MNSGLATEVQNIFRVYYFVSEKNFISSIFMYYLVQLCKVTVVKMQLSGAIFDKFPGVGGPAGERRCNTQQITEDVVSGKAGIINLA